MIFAVLVKHTESRIGALLEQKFPNDSYKFAPNAWFVSAPGASSKDLWDKLSVPAPYTESDVTVITRLTGHYGVAESSLWEWIATKGSVQPTPSASFSDGTS